MPRVESFCLFLSLSDINPANFFSALTQHRNKLECSLDFSSLVYYLRVNQRSTLQMLHSISRLWHLNSKSSTGLKRFTRFKHSSLYNWVIIDEKKSFSNIDTCHWHLLNFFVSKAGNTNWAERLSTVDLLIKVACFTNGVNNVFNIRRSLSKLVSTRRSTVQSCPLQ
jgi:hypothetical protein